MNCGNRTTVSVLKYRSGDLVKPDGSAEFLRRAFVRRLAKAPDYLVDNHPCKCVFAAASRD